MHFGSYLESLGTVISPSQAPKVAQARCRPQHSDVMVTSSKHVQVRLHSPLSLAQLSIPSTAQWQYSVDSLLCFPSRTRGTVQCAFHPGQEGLFSVDSLLSFPSRTRGTVQCGLAPVLSIQDKRDCSVWTPSCAFHPGQEGLFSVDSLLCFPSRTRGTVQCRLPPVLSIQDKRDCSVWTPSCAFHPGQEGLFSVDSLLCFEHFEMGFV